MITFLYNYDKSYLLNTKKYLPKGVFVENEFPKELQWSRTILRPVLKLANKTDLYKGKCKMEVHHLVINKTKYDISNIHELPSEISGMAATKTDDDMVCYFGQLSSFSNFYASNFIVDDCEFVNLEQYIQWTKASYFKDSAMANLVLASDDPIEVKSLGKSIVGYDENRWKEVGLELVRPGTRAKFEQPPLLLKMLQITHPKTIVEATYDKTWGTGIPLDSPDALIEEKWYDKG